MKTLTRTTLASVAVLSVLAGCAPAKRATNKPTAATNANPASASAIAPFNNTAVVNAAAFLPVTPPTDNTVPAGSVNLVTTTKDQPLTVYLDGNGNPSLSATSLVTSNNQLSNMSFKCTSPAQATLDKCVDMELDVSVQGSDNQAHPLQILISRRGAINVDEKIVDPKNPTATGAPENPSFGTAFYQSTQVTDPNATDKTKAIRVFEVAYIKAASAKPTDTAQSTGMVTWGTSNKVLFYMQGALVDTSGNPLTCAQTGKNATCGADPSVAPIDQNSLNLIKSFIVQMSDKTLKTVLLTVQTRNSSDPTKIVGSTDVSTMLPTLSATTNSGSNPAPAPATNPPAAPASATNPAATSQAVGGSVSSSGGPMVQKPAAPPANPPAPATNSNPAASGNPAPATNPPAAPANSSSPDTDAAGNFQSPSGT